MAHHGNENLDRLDGPLLPVMPTHVASSWRGNGAALAAASHFPLTFESLWVFLNLPPLSASVGFSRWVEVPTATDVIPN